MNCLQIMKQARYDADAMRVSNTPSGMWNDEEVLNAANVAMDTAARILRLSGSDILTRTTKTTDGILVLIHENYSPSASLRITADDATYTLPENCVRIVSIRPITSGFENVRFHPVAAQDSRYLALRSVPLDQLASANNYDTDYYYTVTDARTLTLAPTPKDTFDIELVYHIRPSKLKYVSNGTVQRTNGQVTVTGSSTSWLSDGIRFPADLLVGVTDINTVVLSTSYPTLGSNLASDTTLTLARAATTTDSVGQSYILAMVPKLPEEHHTWLAQLTAAIMLRKVDIDLSTKLQSDLTATFMGAITPEVTLRQLQESLITEPYAIPL